MSTCEVCAVREARSSVDVDLGPPIAREADKKMVG